MDFFLCFIPLFIAIDVVGLIPVFIHLTAGLSAREKKGVARTACITALTVSAGFVFLGERLFLLLGVTVNDFRIAGGLLLLVFSVEDLILGGKPRRTPTATLGVVPLGMPLIVGPGVLTTALVLVQQHGYVMTLAALSVNVVVVFLALRLADAILRIITPAGAAAVAKIASLFLAAIGVMFLRNGIEATVRDFLKSR